MANTQIEELVWHKYPEEKPPARTNYRCQTIWRESYSGDRIEKFVTMYWAGKKFIDEPIYYGLLGNPAYEWGIIEDSDVAAWAEEPKGWKE